MSMATRQALDVLVGALIEQPRLHEPGVLVLEADGVTIRHEPLPEKTLLDYGFRLWELHFGVAPRLAAEKPRAAALVLPVRRVPRRREPIEPVDTANGGYSLLVGCCDAAGALGVVLRPDGESGFTEEEVDGNAPIQVEAAPLAFIWQPHPFPPHGSLPRLARGRSALLRFVERELEVWLPQIAPLDEFLRGCTPIEQVLVFQWLLLDNQLAALRNENRELRPLLDRLQLLGQRYQRVSETSSSYAELALAVIAGAEADEPPPNLGALRHGLGVTLDAAHAQGLSRFGPYNLDPLTRELAQIAPPEVDTDAIGVFLRSAGTAFLNLLYIHECMVRQRIPLGAEELPLPADADACIGYLMRLMPVLPLVMNSPALGRFVPRSAERLFPLSAAAHARLAQECPDPDKELAVKFAEEIAQQRHYALDHVAIVDVDGFGLRRLTLAPERREDDQIAVDFLAEHRLGAFGGELGLSDEGDELALPFVAGSPEAERIAPAVELMVLAVWRDLVVPQVIEEQYETEVVRRPKEKGDTRRQQRKGNVGAIRYLPRRIVLRRAEEAARKERGAPTLRRLYWVGAYARRLREGEHRSYEADEFAREIGIPLQPWQTVVQPHPRGGTEEERERAKADPPEIVRHWRSWSALDILRSRSSVREPVG